MRKQYLQGGKIVGTHGVRGIVRVQPWCDSNEVLCGFKKIYLNNGNALAYFSFNGSVRRHGEINISILSIGTKRKILWSLSLFNLDTLKLSGW